MNTLFLRIYLSSLAFIFIAFFLVMFIANTFIYSKLLIDTSESMHQVITQALILKPVSRWPEEIKTYNTLISDYTVSLIDLKSLSTKEQQQLSPTKAYNILSEILIDRADLYTLSRLPGSHWILKIDEADNNKTPLNEWIDVGIISLLLITTLAFALFLLIRKLTTPIQHLTHVAEKLGKGDWSARADKGLPPPMNTLAEGFNIMADHLNTTLQEQQILIGAIPHELRSPLGRARFALDMTRNRTSVQELHQDIEKIDQYVDEMQQVTDEIVELTRLQNQHAIKKEKLQLSELLNTIAKQHQQETPHINLGVSCDPSLNTFVNAPLLKRAIHNVLSNAARYAQSTITLTAWQETGTTIIQIDDDGTGIPEGKLNEIFVPFSTLDTSRSRTTGGIGLGLSIVKLIMKKHGGEVIASHSPQGGARFKLCWISHDSYA